MNSEPIRIAHVMGKMISGGVESVVMNYYRHIDKDKIQFDFIVDEDSTHIPYEEIENMGGKVVLVPPYQKVGLYIKELKKIFKEKKYRIVHSHVNSLSVFPLYAAKKVNVPVRIAHSHSTSNKKEWKKNIIKNILKLFSKANATHYFCCSELAGCWLFGKNTYDKNKVDLISNAINIDKFIYNQKIRDEVRKQLNINHDTVVVGHVGRFVEQKNHEFLIDIFNEIHRQKSNSVLLLAGNGPLINNIKMKVNKLGLQDNVRFLGIRNDIEKIMQGMDIFLLPSLYEGLPVVGVEAQASGLLCILSDEMTKETKVLESTEFISLEKTAYEWSNIILEKYEVFTRKNRRKDIIKANFEIKTEAKKLEERYLNLVKRCG